MRHHWYHTFIMSLLVATLMAHTMAGSGTCPINVMSPLLNSNISDRTGTMFTNREPRSSDAIAGNPVVGSVDYPRAAMERVNTIVLESNEHHLKSAVFDAAHGYAYFGTLTNPGRIVKIDLNHEPSSPIRVNTLELNPNDKDLVRGLIDETNGFAYFITHSYPPQVIKVALNPVTSPPTRVAALTLDGPGPLTGVIDVLNGYAYFGTFDVLSGPARALKVAVGAGFSAPTRTAAVAFNQGEISLASSVIDDTHGYAYFGTMTNPGRIVKVALGNGAEAPTRVGSVTLNEGESGLISAAIDRENGYAYFGTWTQPGRIVKVALGGGSNPPYRVGAITLNSGEDCPLSAVIDPAGGYAYFGTDTQPGRVVKVALGKGSNLPTRVGSMTLNSGEDALESVVINPTSNYAYFGTGTTPGRVVAVALTQKGLVKFTRFTLAEAAALQQVSIYSHAAQGNVRLAIYYEQSPGWRTLVWQSASTSNTAENDYLYLPVNGGMPSQVTLRPGVYHLAWQIDTTANVPSYTQGAMGDGSWLPLPYGPFPAQLDKTSGSTTAWTTTDERWTGYITYESRNGIEQRVWLQYEETGGEVNSIGEASCP